MTGKLTAQDVALLRAIVAWRKRHGVEFVNWRGLGPVLYRMSSRTQVTWDKATWQVGISDGRFGAYVWYPVKSLTQAVDLVVAFGYLPPRFSSAYKAGWDASSLWHDPSCDEPSFRRTFHDPDNIGFPALEPTW